MKKTLISKIYTLVGGPYNGKQIPFNESFEYLTVANTSHVEFSTEEELSHYPDMVTHKYKRHPSTDGFLIWDELLKP